MTCGNTKNLTSLDRLKPKTRFGSRRARSGTAPQRSPVTREEADNRTVTPTYLRTEGHTP